MNREEFIRDCDGLEKLVRTEFGYNQENMSEILGISKKRWWKLKREDPVWVERKCRSLQFVFRQRRTGIPFRRKPKDLIQALAFTHKDRIYPEKRWAVMSGGASWKPQTVTESNRTSFPDITESSIVMIAESAPALILRKSECICRKSSREGRSMFMKPKKEIRLYNVILPIWMLWIVPLCG